jgi:PIN domain nuclease of toxin-antitoxin system
VSGKLFVLDACAVIAFFNDEKGSDKVEKLFRQGDRPPSSLFMHEINLLEIFYGVYRDEGEDLAEQAYLKVLKKIHQIP